MPVSFHTPPPEAGVDKSQGEWNTPTRARVRALKLAGTSQSDIRRLTNVPQRSQARIIKEMPAERLNRTLNGRIEKDRRLGRLRIGRLPTVTKLQLLRIVEAMQGRYAIQALSWDELAVRYKLQVKGRRLKELMNGIGYYKCKACQRAWIDRKQADTRKAFATEHLSWLEWRIKLIYFSDEVHFQKASRKAEWIVRNRQERYSGDCIQKKFKLGSSELHCWSMVAYGYKGPLIFYGNGKGGKGQMTMEVYRNKILPLVVERRDELRKQGIEMIYQEDNNGSL